MSARALPARAASDRGRRSPSSSRRCAIGAKIACGSGQRQKRQVEALAAAFGARERGNAAPGARARRAGRAVRARTGTAISAAAVGVGARRSAAWSISVVSVSCPTAEMSGIGDSAAARTTSSSLNAHRSSIEPPPRATISRSGRGLDRGKAADRRGDLRRRALALHRHRPQDHMRRAAILEPVEDVADHRAGRRGDDADDPRQERQLALALGREQAFGGERLAAFFEQREQRALARELHPLDDDLVFGAPRIGGELAGRDDLGAVLGPEREGAGTASARSPRRCRRSRPSA